MAQGETGEKTERATPKKREEARKEGDIAKSMELPSVFVLMAGIVTLNGFSYFIYKRLETIMRSSLTFDSIPEVTPTYVINTLYNYSIKYAATVAPVMGAVFLAALFSNLLMVGFNISWKAIAFKFSKLDPIKGLKSKFSSKSLAELIKSILKIAIISILTYYAVKSELDPMKRLFDNEIAQILLFMSKVIFKIFIWVLLATLFLALADFAFQKWKWEEDHKMTKQEVKEEHKQAEGDPQVKSRIKQLQFEAAKKRMMAEVPKADVIVTNPTHLAVAIQYDPLTMTAPTVTAKGAGAIAARIREIGTEAGVPVVENKPLARNLYKISEIGEEVPMDLYQAVAELLAYVYRLKGNNV